MAWGRDLWTDGRRAAVCGPPSKGSHAPVRAGKVGTAPLRVARGPALAPASSTGRRTRATNSSVSAGSWARSKVNRTVARTSKPAGPPQERAAAEQDCNRVVANNARKAFGPEPRGVGFACLAEASRRRGTVAPKPWRRRRTPKPCEGGRKAEARRKSPMRSAREAGDRPSLPACGFGASQERVESYTSLSFASYAASVARLIAYSDIPDESTA